MAKTINLFVIRLLIVFLVFSYFGISETIIHFVIYEYLKTKLRERSERNSLKDGHSPDDSQSAYILLESMIAAASSKTFASVIAYPHGM